MFVPHCLNFQMRLGCRSGSAVWSTKHGVFRDVQMCIYMFICIHPHGCLRMAYPSRLCYQAMATAQHIKSNDRGGVLLRHLRQQEARLLHERQPQRAALGEHPSPERQREVPHLNLWLLQARAVSSGGCSSCCGTAAPQATLPPAEPAPQTPQLTSTYTCDCA